jgi:SAM-dependent methyltransferase
MKSFENAQKAHYRRILSEYERHYDDECAQAYRRRFMCEVMLAGIHLDGASVLEAMCGSGQATGFLLSRGARVTGLDISDVALASFRKRWPTCPAVCSSILKPPLRPRSFDVVLVVGGLHHVHPHLDEAVTKIHELLADGGVLCFAEPHAGSVVNMARWVWYRLDRRVFAEGESAVDLGVLKARHASLFRSEREVYFGNLAYFLVLNSMIFRIPPEWKATYASCCMRVEALLSPLHTRFFSAGVLCVWRKV